VSADLFSGLSSLERIYLDRNSLSSIPAGLFSGLSNLKTIYLGDNNSLSSVPADLFSGLTNLQSIGLHGNSLSSVPEDLFSGLTNLQWIYLFNNNLSSVPADLFSGLTNLEMIFLDNNNLNSVPADLFSGLSSLQQVNLSYNSLNSVSADLFSGLTNLEAIYLQHNSLSSVSADLFSRLANLKKIYLNNNSLSSVPADLFSGLTKLKRILLSGNNLSCRPGLPSGASFLNHLFENDTVTANLPPCQPCSVQDTICDLTNYNLRNIPGNFFSGLSNLQEIHLGYNNLNSVPADLFNGLTNLQEIWLWNNQLTSVPADLFNGLTNLQEINLNSNNLSSVPADLFNDLTNLQEIWLSGNNLSTVPENLFSGLTNLQGIWLYNNRLSSVPADLFSGLSNLIIIDLGDNSLSSVPADLFSDLTNLQYIYLNKNSLSSVPEGLFSGLSNLVFIKLDNNSLSSVSASLFSGLSSLLVVDLTHNSMSCHPGYSLGISIYMDSYALPTCTSSSTGARSSQINVSPSDDQFISIPLDQDGTSQITINLSDYFDHLFDDNLISPYIDTEELTMNLTYIASSSNEEAVTVSIADSSLTVTPIKPGTSIVTVSFTVTGQLSGIVRSLSHESLARTFNVVVYSTEATVPMNLIPDQNITTPMTINLSDYFNGFLDHQFISMNPDSMSASLIYTANSSNRTAVTVSIDDSLLTLTPVSSGTSTVTVNLTAAGQLPAAYPIVSRRSIARAFNVTANVSDTVDSNLGITEINKQVLPSILDKVTSRQVAAITDRLDSISSASYPLTESSMDVISMENVVTDVGHYLAGRHQQLHTGTFHWDWKQALSGRNFSFPLPGANLSQATAKLEQATADSLFSNPSLWGSVDYYSIEDRVDTMTLDGDLLSFYLGMDVQPRHDMVTGMLVNVNQFGSALQHIDGLRQGDHYDVHLTTFSPYFSWFASDHLSLWASAAYGRGEAVLSNSSLNTSTDGHTSKGAFSGFSLGGRLLLAQRSNSSFALLFDGSTSSFLDVDLQRARLAAQASRSFYLNSGGSIDTSLDLALLMGSAAASVAELAGSFSWTPSAQSDLTASFSGRTLLFGGQQRGWGIDADIYFSPGEDDEGFSISVAPSLGITTPQFTGLHSIDSLLTSDMDFTNQLPEAHLNAEIAYGLRTTNALFTPYSNVSFSPSTSSYSAGLRYDMATKLEIDLRATHQKRSSGHHNAVLLQLSIDL